MPAEVAEENSRQVQVKFYSDYYTRNKSDSPDASRSSLLRRASACMSELAPKDFVLELGSGRQIVTREYLRDRNTQPSFTIVTLDIANLARKQLLAKDSAGVTHIRADGGRLPFNATSFGLVISSMALDFMGVEAIPEVYRVLKPGGRAEINLHHPNLIPEDLDQLLARRQIPKAERTVLEYWAYLREKGILTNDSHILRERFIQYGLYVEKLIESHDNHDTWWEVSLKKDGTNSTSANSYYRPDMTKQEVLALLAHERGRFFRDWGNV